MTEYYTWKKHENIQLNPYMNTSEVDCQCSYASCIEQKINKELVARVLRMRLEAACPFFYTSGFRCSKRQADLRAQGMETAKGISDHEKGDALDIRCKDMKKLQALAEENFEAVGVARSFVHVDMRTGKKRRWGYTKV